MEAIKKVLKEFGIKYKADLFEPMHIAIIQKMGIEKFRSSLQALFENPRVLELLRKDEADTQKSIELRNKIKALYSEIEVLQTELSSLGQENALIKLGKKLGHDFDFDVHTVKERILFSIILGKSEVL